MALPFDGRAENHGFRPLSTTFFFVLIPPGPRLHKRRSREVGEDVLFLFDRRATYALTRVLPLSVQKTGDLTPPTPLSNSASLRGESQRGFASPTRDENDELRTHTLRAGC